MRIAVVADRFPSVSETFVTGQVAGLAAAGHEVVVVAERGDGSAVPPGVTVVERRPGGPVGPLLRVLGRSPRAAVRLVRCLLRGEEVRSLPAWAEPLLAGPPFDAVLCHFGWNARKAALVAPALRPARLVAVLHGADVTSWVAGDEGAARYGPVFAAFDRLLPVSDRWRDRLLSWGADPARTSVLRVGIDVDAFPATTGEGPALSVARLVEKKGIEVAIRAVARVPGLRYDVIGDGPLRPALERLVGEVGVADRVRLLGAQPPAEVRDALATASILVAPSVTAADGDQEGIPVAIMEGMASGLPVVATEHSGIPELVEHEVTGLLVPERDVDALAAALDRVHADADLRRRFGAAGRAVVRERHDARRQLDVLLDHLAGSRP